MMSLSTSFTKTIAQVSIISQTMNMVPYASLNQPHWGLLTLAGAGQVLRFLKQAYRLLYPETG